MRTSRFVPALFVLFALFGCMPEPEPLPVEPVDVVVLGGSVAGLTVASALKGYDEAVNLVLVEPEPYFVTEPYLNLYLVGMIDERLVYSRYDSAAERRGYRLQTELPERIDREKQQIVFKERILQYKRLVDARYCPETGGAVPASRESLERIKTALAKPETARIAISVSSGVQNAGVRAGELESLIREFRSGRVRVERVEDADVSAYDLVIPYGTCEGTESFYGNFFALYNRGLDEAAGIVKELYGKNFLPNMVGEEMFVFSSGRTLTGSNPQDKTETDGAAYLAKVKKIKYDIL